MITKKIAVAEICLSLAGCGYRGTWDFPFPKPGVREPSLEEKTEEVANFLEKKENYVYLYSGKLLIEIFKDENKYLETSVTYTDKERENATGMVPVRMVFWADQLPYGSPDVALVENNLNVQEIDPKTTCIADMQEMTIDAVYENLKGRSHQLEPNQPFYRYFHLCFNELTNF
ncbi:MAG: hypothetical protein AABW48_02825 [Nanoarchaeota archaeon]